MNIQKNVNQLLGIGLTQAQIGKAINRAQATVCDMASGTAGCTRPSADVVSNLRKLLKRHKLKEEK